MVRNMGGRIQSTDGPRQDLILDGGSLFARSWFISVKEQGAISVESVFFRSLFTLISGRLPNRPDRMLVCWDLRAKTDKMRATKPDGYETSRKNIRKLCRVIFDCSDCRKGEADDTCAVAAYASESAGNRVYLATSDKDLYQCASDKIEIYSFHDKGVVPHKKMRDKWGVKKPIQIAFYLAIAGDKIDGIDGLPKFGPVRTKQILSQIPESANFWDSYRCVREQIPHNLKEKFDEELGKTLLATEDSDVPIPKPITLCSVSVLREYGMEDILHYYFDAATRVNQLEFEEFEFEEA